MESCGMAGGRGDLREITALAWFSCLFAFVLFDILGILRFSPVEESLRRPQLTGGLVGPLIKPISAGDATDRAKEGFTPHVLPSAGALA